MPAWKTDLTDDDDDGGKGSIEEQKRCLALEEKHNCLSQPEPGIFESKQQHKQLFTAADVITQLDELSELDIENDEEYPASDLDSVSDSDIESDSSSEKEKGHGPGPSGDRRPAQTNTVPVNWNKSYTPVDLSFDDSNCGPRNISPNINENSTPQGFVDLFLNEAFW
uniref:Uncharacterized protein n=1 Tax=Octopus bimaculoides TaxID=37653 RepID=A0A0L8FGV4_OCTBM